MEFKSLKNIESSFRQIRLFSIVFLASCTLLTVFSVWKSYRFAEEQREKIYVLDEGKSLIMALSQEPRATARWKRGSTCRRLHELFFTLAPRQGGHRVEHKPGDCTWPTRACTGITGTGTRKVLQPAHQRERQPDGGGGQHELRFRQLSLPRHHLCPADDHPGEQHHRNASLVTRCRLQSTVRSDNNPQGFLAEHFEILENRDLRTVER